MITRLFTLFLVIFGIDFLLRRLVETGYLPRAKGASICWVAFIPFLKTAQVISVFPWMKRIISLAALTVDKTLSISNHFVISFEVVLLDRILISVIQNTFNTNTQPAR